MKTSLLVISVGSVTFLVVLMVVTLVVTLSPNTGGPTNYRNYIINSVDPDSIDKFLRNLTTVVHPAGSDLDLEIAQRISSAWKEHGIHNVKIINYDVLLSQANRVYHNQFRITDSNGSEIYASHFQQPPAEGFPQEGQDEIFSFSAFSGIGSTPTVPVVYVNYGTYEDFKTLEELGVAVQGKIALIRYGSIFRGDKVRFAEDHGAVGVILYTDPADAAPLGSNFTYPNSVYAPPGAVQLGSLRIQGDLLTPGYPATKEAYRLPIEEADLPKIPVQPVGYEDAYQILSRLQGDRAPDDWQGDLNLTYHLGPGMDGNKVKLEVNNINSVKTVYNVVGELIGTEEPDRYVLVGNHHDAWTYGGIDPSSATATQLELTRVFGKMYRDGWRPRRTLVFCSWSAEEPGVIGSTEFAEEHSTSLMDRAVAYLNVDLVMEGNYSLVAQSVPLLYDVIVDTSKQVPNPDPKEVSQGHLTLYDTWLARYPDNSSGTPVPSFGTIGTGSDFRAYFFNLGIPSMDMAFTVAPGDVGLPLYHTAYETYELTTLLMDRGLLFHQASARMWGLLALRISTEPLLPFSLRQYSDFMETSFQEFVTEYNTQLEALNISTFDLKLSVDRVSSAVDSFLFDVNKIDLENPLVVRRYNDAMMLLERSFLTRSGLPDRPLLNHVFLAPSSRNGYTWDTFPGLKDLLRKKKSLGQDTATTKAIKQHMAALVHHFNMAAKALFISHWY